MPENGRRYLVSSEQVRGALVAGGVGAVALIIGILLLATARPQSSYVPVDESQHQQRLAAAEAALGGFELTDTGGARLEIGHAMALVAERGVGLPMVAGGATAPPATAPLAADAEAPAEGEVLAQADVDGAAVYAQQCAACHQPTGAGIPGAFPPIAGHIGDLVNADRSFPGKLVLFGMVGPIQVNGASYNGLMPAVGAALTDAEVAAVLNHVVQAWGDADVVGDAFEPYGADEIAAWRELGLSNAQVHELRQTLELP